MAGNYGGNSLPTTPISGDTLWSGRLTTYANWECTKIVGTLATANFTYEGTVYHINTDSAGNSSIDMLIKPSKLTAIPYGVWFACYECGCSGSMTGTASASSVTYVGAAVYAPTIIGSGGLNS